MLRQYVQALFEPEVFCENGEYKLPHIARVFIWEQAREILLVTMQRQGKIAQL